MKRSSLIFVILALFISACTNEVHTKGTEDTINVADDTGGKTSKDTGESDQDTGTDTGSNTEKDGGEGEDTGGSEAGAEEDAGAPCETDSNCSANYICADGHCVAMPDSCILHTDCPSGYLCVDGRCKKSDDVTEDDAGKKIPCEIDAQCGEAGKCVDGFCEMKESEDAGEDAGDVEIVDGGEAIDASDPERCHSDNDCQLEGFPYCVKTYCKECKKDENCAEKYPTTGYKYYCLESRCYESPPACKNNYDCPPNYYCNNNFCVPIVEDGGIAEDVGDAGDLQECLINQECPKIEYCVNNLCMPLPQCDKNTPCPVSQGVKCDYDNSICVH